MRVALIFFATVPAAFRATVRPDDHKFAARGADSEPETRRARSEERRPAASPTTLLFRVYFMEDVEVRAWML